MMMTTYRRRLLAAALLALAPLAALHAESLAPDELVKQISTDVIEAAKTDKAIQAGDIKRVAVLVEQKVMPHVNFQRMTASAVGRYWRQASPEQQQRLQAEFKLLLLRSYAGALSQVKDQTVELKATRGRPDDGEVVVRTELRGRGDAIQLDYRLEKAGNDWKIYDVNVLGVWLVENYRNSFAQEISANGLDGLISKLEQRNKAAAAKG